MREICLTLIAVCLQLDGLYVRMLSCLSSEETLLNTKTYWDSAKFFSIHEVLFPEGSSSHSDICKHLHAVFQK